MPSVGPELAVRLSAQGVQDVVNAFARVRQEGKKTGADSGTWFSPLGDSLKGLTGMLVTFAAGFAAIKLAQFVEQSRESAENIGKLSEKSGAGVGTLSALALSAHDSEVSFEELSKGVVKLAKAQVQAVQGGKEQIKAFAGVGVSIKDLNALDPGDLFVKVAQKMAALPAGADRTAIALKLFGRAGAELIPMLDALGTDGFDQAVEKAKRLGLFLDDDMVNSSRAAQDALHELEDIAAGLATRFNAGFMPGFTAGVETLAEELEGHGVDSVRDFGDTFGKVFAYALEGFLVWRNNIVAGFKQIGAESTFLWAGLKAGAQLIANPNAAGAAGFVTSTSAATSTLQQRLKTIEQQRASGNNYAAYELDQNLDASRKRIPTKYPRGTGADGDGTSDEDKKKALEEAAKLAKAYSDLMQARADNEIAILRAASAVEEADDKRKYDAGLLSLDEYYDRRAKRIEDAYAAEYNALVDKQTAAQNLPQQTQEQRDKREQEIEKVQAAKTLLAIKGQGDITAAEDERAKARHDSAEKELADEQKLATMSGDRAGAARLALQSELQQYTELLTKQGKSADYIANATAAYKQRATAKIDFGVNQEQGSNLLGSLGQDVANVQGRQGSGALSQVAATAQIITLQKQQLPLLRDIGDQMLLNALAADDPQITAQALAYNAQLDLMELKLKNVKSAATEFTDQLTSTGYNGIVDFFADGISGAKSFGDALGDLASTFEKMVGRMVAQLLTFYLLETVVGFIAPDSSFAKSLSAKGPFGSGFASGGWTGGSAGKPAGIVHGQEFVVKAGPAAANRATLEAMNAGLSVAPVATSADYATAMPSSAASTTVAVGSPIVNIHNYTGQQTQTQQSKGSDGSDIIDVLIGKVAQDVARGGTVGKTMQSTFGLTRRGTVTG